MAKKAKAKAAPKKEKEIKPVKAPVDAKEDAAPEKPKKTGGDYNASNITVLEGLDAVRKRPANAYAALDDAFGAAMTQLKEYRRIVQGDVKYKNGTPRGARGESSIG